MRADRLLAILLLLQARGRLTAPDLAARLEVSVRTVYRDLDALSAAGIPIYATSGRNGGVDLPDGYRLDVTALKPTEARALILGGAGGPLTDLDVGTTLDAAVRKLSAALPAGMRDEAERARQRLLVDGLEWWRPAADPLPHLHTIEEAVWSDRRLRLAYARFGRPTSERVVDPYALVAKRGVWYLVAAVLGRTEPDAPADPGKQGEGEAPADTGKRGEGEAGPHSARQVGPAPGPVVFRVSRIQAAEVLAEPSRRPADFDLGRFWSDWCAAFLASVPSYDATLSATAGAAARIGRDFARGVWPPPASEPGPDGRVTLRVDLETEEVATATVLGYGPAVEVLAPPALRERVASQVAATAALYRPSD